MSFLKTIDVIDDNNMTQNIASYKLQMFCILQVLQCLGFEVWAHLGSRVFGVFGLGYLHYKHQQLCTVQCALHLSPITLHPIR